MEFCKILVNKISRQWVAFESLQELSMLMIVESAKDNFHLRVFNVVGTFFLLFLFFFIQKVLQIVRLVCRVYVYLWGEEKDAFNVVFVHHVSVDSSAASGDAFAFKMLMESRVMSPSDE